MQRTAVAIPLRSSEQFARDAKKAVRDGADYIEARVDFNRKMDIEALATTLKPLSRRLILTLMPKSQNGKFEGEASKRVGILKSLGEEISPRYVTVEYDIASRFGDVGFEKIVSWHNFSLTPSKEQMLERYEIMKKWGSIVKIVPTALTVLDSIRVLSLYGHVKRGSLIAFAMGDFGTTTRVLCTEESMGAPFTYVSLYRPIAPGQWSLIEMRRIFKARNCA